MSTPPIQSLIAAIKSGDLPGVRDILDAEHQLVRERSEEAPSLPLLAVYYGQPEVAALLVEKDAEVSIFEAAAMGLLDDAQALLASDVQLANHYNEDGFQPLGLASFFGHPHLARLLLEHGAEVNSASRNAQQVMPLHSAVARAIAEIVRMLLNAGADAKAVQQCGYTPLHEAARKGHSEILEMLLQAGADPEARTEDGATPLDLAVRSGNERAVGRLEEAVAEKHR